MNNAWAPGSARTFVQGCEESLPEASVTKRKSGESESQWRLHVFITVSNYDTRGRQESERTSMFCDTDSEAKNPQHAGIKWSLIKTHSKCGSLPFYA